MQNVKSIFCRTTKLISLNDISKDYEDFITKMFSFCNVFSKKFVILYFV